MTDDTTHQHRAPRENLLNMIDDTTHAYLDGLRWGPEGILPAATLIVAPTTESLEYEGGSWLADASFIREHRVGAVAMRPGAGPPDWLRDFLLDAPPPLTHDPPAPNPS